MGAGLLLSACGSVGAANQAETGAPSNLSKSEWTDLVAEAQDEGEVIIYSSLGTTEEAFKLFTDKYPDIKVTVVRAPGSDTIGRLDQEIEAGVAGADVTFHAQPEWFNARTESGDLAAVQLSPDAVSAGWDERIADSSFATVYAFPLMIGYNTSTAKPVDSAEDLLKMGDDVTIGVGDATIDAAVAFMYDTWMDAYGPDFVERLSQKNVVVESSGTTGIQSVASGEYDYYVGLTPGKVEPLQADGATVDQIVPDVVSGGVYSAGSLTTAEHPAAAQLFVNWLMTDGQDVFVEKFAPASVPTNPDGAIPWGQTKVPEPGKWTSAYTKEWIQENWTPHFN